MIPTQTSSSSVEAESSISSVDSTPVASEPQTAPVAQSALTAPRAFGLRPILLVILVLVLLAGVGYKVNEWLTLQAFAKLYNQTLTAELTTGTQTNAYMVDLLDDEDNFLTETMESDEPPEASTIEREFESLAGEYRVLEDKMTGYNKLLEENKAQFVTFRDSRLKWLVGKPKQNLTDTINSQLTFYDLEIGDSTRNIAYLHFTQNVTEVGKDALLLGLFAVNTGAFSDEEALDDYFGDISSLEKYTRSDFAFRDEANLKKYYSYGLESLEKQQNYFGSVYLALKDLVAGDEQSAQYKFSRLGNDSVNVSSIDYDRIRNEGKDKVIEVKKQLVESLVKRYDLLQTFNSSVRPQYTGLPQVDEADTKLTACYVYIYKTDAYQVVKTDQLPKGEDLGAIIKELGAISPKTDSVDTAASDSIAVKRDKDKLTFTCKSVDGKEYVYTAIDQEEDEKKEDDKKDE